MTQAVQFERVPFEFDSLPRWPLVAIDVETTGLYWYRDQLFGIAIAAYDPDRGQLASKYYDIRETPRIIEALAREVPLWKRTVNYHMKFDAHFLRNSGIFIPDDRMECSQTRAALINEHERDFSLDAIAKKCVGIGKYDGIYEELAAMFGGNPTRSVQMKNLHRAPVSMVSKYACPDAEAAVLLHHWQDAEIDRQNLHRVWGLEKKLTPILVEIERQGIRVDLDRTHRELKASDARIDAAQQSLNRFAGKFVNANSPKQMRELFKPEQGEDGRWRIGQNLLESTEKGQPSINADALRSLASRGIEAAQHALNLRKIIKAKSFLQNHILDHELMGRVFPNYNQTRGENELGTGTGRFSIDDPAMQQIPARDEEIASIVRACFLPEVGEDWGSMDYGQFEFRWFAHYTKDENILTAYRNNPDTDFHQVTADLTGIPRKPRFAGDANAKQINLGLVFGMGQGKLAEEMGLPYTVKQIFNSDGTVKKEWLEPGPEAMGFFDKYHTAIPGVKKLLSNASSIARSRGYVMTAMERHIRFPGGQFVHKAGGLVFQGTSADCMKQKMVEMWPMCKEWGVRMLLSVHDELNFSMADTSPETIKAIKNEYVTFDGERCPIKCRVPITCDMGIGPNWWEASK